MQELQRVSGGQRNHLQKMNKSCPNDFSRQDSHRIEKETLTMQKDGISRRSFLKKTTALAVGVSASGLFSGLVYAADQYHYKAVCAMTMEAERDSEGNTLFYHCFFKDPAGVCYGSCYKRVTNIDGTISQVEKQVRCDWHTSRATSVVCDSKNPTWV
jgi:hypothetical protein